MASSLLLQAPHSSNENYSKRPKGSNMEFAGAESFLPGSNTYLSNQSRPEIGKVQVLEYTF